MKRALILPFVILAASAFAQSGDMKGMEMKGMEMKDMGKKPAARAQAAHKATGVVKKVDSKAGTVTLAHDPVKSLNWPAMTMGFQVKDKMLLDKLPIDRKAEVEFMQRGKDYVITSVK